MAGKEVYDDSFYASESKSSLSAAEQIVPIIYEMFKPTSVIDIGCGVGSFLKEFHKLGVEIKGMDGDYVPRDKLAIDQEFFSPADLSKSYYNDEKYDLVMTLEVAEHIDGQNADQFIVNLCKFSNIVVFSAAIPYQGGDHHVNEQPQSYWVNKFISNKFIPVDVIRPLIWNNTTIDFWYKQNMLVFIHESVVSNYTDLTSGVIYDVIHPKLFQDRLNVLNNYQIGYKNLSSFLDKMIENNIPYIIGRNSDGYFATKINLK